MLIYNFKEKTMKNLFILVLVLCVYSSIIHAQNYVKIRTDGWGKGYDSFKPAIADIDKDGLLDLLIGRNHGKILHYEQATNYSTDFILITEEFNDIDAGLHAAPTFADIDGDSLLDLFIGISSGNLDYYEQADTGSVGFTLITEDFISNDAYWEAMPLFVDLDNDGLLDLLVGNDSGELRHLEQIAVDTASFASIDFTFNDIDYFGIAAPAIEDLDNDGLLDLLIGKNTGQIAHYEQVVSDTALFTLITESFNDIDVGSFATPVFTELDNDENLDLLIGNANGIIHYYIQSEPDSNTFDVVTENLLNSIDVGGYSSPTFADVDNDGLWDLLVGQSGGSITRYEQTNPGSITMDLITSHFSGIDLEYISISPTLIDLDNDSLLDLIVGNEDSLIHYEQSDTNYSSFNHIGHIVKLFDESNSHIAPTFADLDNDSLLDLLVGRQAGWMTMYEQTSVNSNDFSQTDYYFLTDIGDDVSPAFTDLDNDGYWDLIIGENTGNLFHYEEREGRGFILQTENFYNIDIESGSPMPFFFDIDNDGWVDLFIGESDGGIHFYKRSPGSILTDDASDITASSAILNGSLYPAGLQMRFIFEYGTTTDYGDTVIADSSTSGNIDAGVEATGLLSNQLYHFRAVAYSGNTELIGEDKTFTTADSTTDIIEKTNIPQSFSLGFNYPNPFNPTTALEYAVPVTSHLSLVIYDILGREVRTLVNEVKSAGFYTIQWDGTNASGQQVNSGVYFYQLNTDQRIIQTKKMMLLK